jgi:hypothetical protein
VPSAPPWIPDQVRDDEAIQAPLALPRPRCHSFVTAGIPANDKGEAIMIILPISLTIAAGAALLNLWLSVRVGRVRTKEKVFIGDGGSEAVTRRMRAHSNFVENTAFVLILLALVELGAGSSMWLWGVGALYLVGRILHALGMDGMMWGRMVGTIITMLTQLGLAITALTIVYLTPTNITTKMVETEAVAPK